MRVVTKTSIILTLLLLSATTLTAAGIVKVSQKNRAFGTANVRIRRGEVVRFTNDDRFLHQLYVEAPSFSFESDEQEPGSDVEIQFSESGLFEVRCHIHPQMLLQVEAH